MIPCLIAAFARWGCFSLPYVFLVSSLCRPCVFLYSSYTRGEDLGKDSHIGGEKALSSSSFCVLSYRALLSQTLQLAAYLAYTPFGATTLAGPPVMPTGGTMIEMSSLFTLSVTFFACISTPCW
jgi:hypothetical protein